MRNIFLWTIFGTVIGTLSDAGESTDTIIARCTEIAHQIEAIKNNPEHKNKVVAALEFLGETVEGDPS